MDSKGKKIGILLVLCAVLVVMAAVVVSTLLWARENLL